jgi:hypothetical protein
LRISTRLEEWSEQTENLQLGDPRLAEAVRMCGWVWRGKGGLHYGKDVCVEVKAEEDVKMQRRVCGWVSVGGLVSVGVSVGVGV